MVSIPGAFDDFRRDPRWSLYGPFTYAFVNIHRGVSNALTKETGISYAWFEVLYRLAVSPDLRLSMTELARQALLTGASVSRLVDRMSVPGYVVREQSDDDRRVVFVCLTDKGSEALGQVLSPLLDIIDAKLASRLEPDAVDELQTLVRTLAAQLRASGEGAASAAVPPPPRDEPEARTPRRPRRR